ncbi:hypothetical protein [Deinococcus multiflagellatus]|uniref:Uncharacterized protein n=1 Tax=Deinococcus multiflagellatus TaxID=1656887 RepID=A0ABW1ZV24_9DEIO|nr:hypothetical protein [Deinococcus multiflagellatus]MBZ9714501.1 hypothetical protein [Deinococcus multiflagellatus]
MTPAHEALIVQLVFLVATAVSGVLLGRCLPSAWTFDVGVAMLGIVTWNVLVWAELGARLPEPASVLRGRATNTFLLSLVLGLVFLS